MSQFFQGVTVGSLPPSVAEVFETDGSDANVSSNAIQILGGTTSNDNDNGIVTDGATNIVTVYLTNRQSNTVTTTDATPTLLASFNLGAVAAAYLFSGEILAYNVTDGTAAAYTFTEASRTDGATATELGTDTKDSYEDASMVTCDFTVDVSGNSFEIEVEGIAGKTIHWLSFFTYRKVS